jgi:type I restriction enzyme S subunit
MNAYESYITTELPWLFKMPYHWDIMRAKYMFQKESRAVSETDEVITCFRDGVVTLRKNRRTTGFTEAIQESGYQGIRKGDLVIHVMDAFAGAVGVSDSNGKGTPVYSVCTAKGDYNNYYYAHIVREMARSGFIQSLYRGIRQRSSDFRFEIFAAQYLPVPPREEQDQIVRYLDWQVSKINKLISARKKQIVLLKEQKQAVINEVVTKGLDPAVPMKDSGVEWIGEIPAEWDVIPLKRQFSFGRGLPIKKSDLKEEGVPVISYGQVHAKTNTGVGLNDTLIRFVDPIYHMTNVQSLVHEGDFIFADTSEDHAGVGNCVYINTSDSIFAGYHTVILRTIEKGFSNYLAYLFLTDTWRSQLRSRVNGVKVYSITQGILKQSTVLIPPSDVQKKIVDYLDGRCSDIDRLIESINSKISLLAEYRTSLISDVVTGQIDVRDIEVPEFEYIADDVDDVSDDENTDLEEIMEEEE